MLCSFSLHAAEWTIGVLALRGSVLTQNYWQQLVDTLNKDIPTEHFRLVPLNLDEMRQAVESQQVNFLLTNPAQFIQLDSRYNLRWLLSLRSPREPNNQTRNVLGSLILVRNDDSVNSLDDLIGKNVGAISPDAFGGYLLGYKVIRDNGYDPNKDFRMQFLGFPADALIYALRDKTLSAAIVPSCLLENMQKEGLINPQLFRPLIQHPASSSCLTSTELYPNWSFAALNNVPDNLVDKVTRILLSSDNDGLRWGAPSSVSQVEALLRSVNQHPQQRQFWRDIISWIVQYQLAIGGIALIFILLGINHIWIAFLVRRKSRQLEQAHNQLRQQEADLEKAQRLSILGEMASGFAHELNQPLSAIRNYAQGSVIRLKQESEQHPLIPALEKIDTQAQRGADIIRNLRSWVGKTHQDQPINYSYQPIIQTVLHLWRLLRIEQYYPKAQLFLPTGDDIELHLPDTLLEQLLSNLINNSLQAGAEKLRLELHPGPNHFLLILQDDAGGMSDQQLHRGIIPFSTTKQDGLGLGLVICQRLIRSQGGDIRLENQLFEDSTDNIVDNNAAEEQTANKHLMGLRMTLIFPQDCVHQKNNPL
ncbi:tetrathionate respiration histidine kinase TtrS [Moellerella wisconsensis]|uniref:tetrathionate respiration histidine kinase TtrS n=1 Tax=Moellerella wisconsensis TaxID=158849 RepID=UPI001F4DE7BE|nr:tetrathionate respiration histidine kinase TtrS [Moellerella wisconsensis]UNH25193.1 PhnD/SsuA/transferrin family substrate-binding protein [Moellerella wisconsensis]